MKLDTRKLTMEMAKRRLKVKELAATLGMKPNNLSNIKTGKVDPRPDTIGRIAEALGCAIEEIIEDEE